MSLHDGPPVDHHGRRREQVRVLVGFEDGDHAELLARGGAYARLYESQFAGAAVTDDDI